MSAVVMPLLLYGNIIDHKKGNFSFQVEKYMIQPGQQLGSASIRDTPFFIDISQKSINCRTFSHYRKNTMVEIAFLVHILKTQLQ